MERGKSKGFANSTGDWIAGAGAAATDGGSTKAIGVSSELSESWQQAMEQAILSDMPCSQSLSFAGAEGALCRWCV